MKSKLALTFIAIFSLASCSSDLKPEQAFETAKTYAELKWEPLPSHIRHGFDSQGIRVHTPDTTLAQHGDLRGYWRPGKTAKGMPYKWGGFDTPESFRKGLAAGKKAGDIANTYKVHADNAGISQESVGIDCSGFISRCWQLERHYDTRELPGISAEIPWADLRLGDILIKSGHVLMYVTYQDGHVIGYEAGPTPSWRARCCAIRVSFLKEQGFHPRRYMRMAPPNPKTNFPLYDITLTRGT